MDLYLRFLLERNALKNNNNNSNNNINKKISKVYLANEDQKHAYIYTDEKIP